MKKLYIVLFPKIIIRNEWIKNIPIKFQSNVSWKLEEKMLTFVAEWKNLAKNDWRCQNWKKFEKNYFSSDFYGFICFKLYSVFHRFRQAKFANDGLILSLSQFTIRPQLPQKNEAHVKSGQNQPKNNHLAT
jgi:hypothetical protein